MGYAVAFFVRCADVRIITLNMGLGYDSLAMLALLIKGELVAEGRALRPAGLDAVVIRTLALGGRPPTRSYPGVLRMCELHGLRLIVLQKPAPAVAGATLR